MPSGRPARRPLRSGRAKVSSARRPPIVNPRLRSFGVYRSRVITIFALTFRLLFMRFTGFYFFFLRFDGSAKANTALTARSVKER